MGGEFDRPDRFGCGAIAMAIFLTLLLFVLLIGMFLLTDVGSSLRSWMQGQQADADSGPGSGDIPYVSDRYYQSGQATASLAGALQLRDQISIDPIASYSQDGLSWISFHDGGATEVLVVFNEPEDSVTVAQGSAVAIGQDEACEFDIRVTESTVSGTVSCASVEVLRDGETAGTASIQLQFSTTTTPMEDGDGPEDGGPGPGDAPGETPEGG